MSGSPLTGAATHWSPAGLVPAVLDLDYNRPGNTQQVVAMRIAAPAATSNEHHADSIAALLIEFYIAERGTAESAGRQQRVLQAFAKARHWRKI